MPDSYEYLVMVNHLPRHFTIVPRVYEQRIAKAYRDYREHHMRAPTYLVLSSPPYQALCLLLGTQGVARAGVKEFHGMQVIHLERWDEEVILVG